MGLMRYDSSVAECCCLGFRARRNSLNSGFVSEKIKHTECKHYISLKHCKSEISWAAQVSLTTLKTQL